MFTNGTSSEKGGVAIYVNEQYNSFEMWIAIKNKNSKNIICIYIHPRYDEWFPAIYG